MISKDKSIDSLLVLQIRAGNRKALGLLVKRWHKKLCKHAYWYTKDRELAKDVVQDCWTVIVKKIDGLRDGASFGSWALSIVTRKTIDILRKDKRERNSLQKYHRDQAILRFEVAPDDTPKNSLECMRASIKELPVQHQMILHLFYLEDLSIRQISDVLLLPQGTVKSRLFTAREKLKLIVKKTKS